MISLVFFLLSNIVNALTINQTCLDNATLQIIQDNFTEVCANGCDNVTNSCSPKPYEQNLLIFIIFCIALFFGWRFLKWVDKR
jgi:hypothetical protein